jgi:hypothetical protein
MASHSRKIKVTTSLEFRPGLPAFLRSILLLASRDFGRLIRNGTNLILVPYRIAYIVRVPPT